MGLKVFGLLMLLFAFGCTLPSGGEDKVGVVVTIGPQAEFAERIGGEKVKVMVMVPQGENPHTYEPTPGQMVEVSKALLYAKVGSGIEFETSWMGRIAEANADMTIVDCSSNLQLIWERGHADPHMWLSPKNAKVIVENIYRGLAEVDPANRDYYWKNKEEYVKELDALDLEVAQTLPEGGKFMVYHPSWAYLARDYGLEQIAIEEEGKEPSPKGLAVLISQARAENITVVFVSPQFNKENAETLANEIGGKVLTIDPLDRDYLENMKKVADALSQGIGNS